MADILSYNLTDGRTQELRKFTRIDPSTKLKLLGIDVASFGDFFADRDGPAFASGLRRTLPGEPKTCHSGAPPVKALTYKDPFGAVYKKYLFTLDGKYVVGGMMIGDTSDYAKLAQMVRNRTPLEVPPSQFILGKNSAAEDDGSDLYVFFSFSEVFPTSERPAFTSQSLIGAFITVPTILRFALVTT